MLPAEEVDEEITEEIQDEDVKENEAVSYTHLTLPTIHLV